MDRDKLARIVREARESRNLTVDQAGQRCGKGELYFLESGEGAGPDTLRKLSEDLDLDYTELLILAGHLTEQDVDRYMESRAA